MRETRASLLLRIRNRRDSVAWGQFDAIYRPLLHRFALARGLDDSEAEDVVQHCMMALTRHIDGFDYDPSKGRFKGWLCTLAMNRIRNLHSRRREQPAASQDLKRDQQREDSPEEQFEQVWLDEHLRHCLEQVKEEVEPTTYAAFQQHVVQQRSVAEVCAAFGLSTNRLYKIKARMLGKLRARMNELLGDDG